MFNSWRSTLSSLLWRQQTLTRRMRIVSPTTATTVTYATKSEHSPAPPDLSATNELSMPYSSATLKQLDYDKYPFYVEREWWKEGKRMTFWSNWRMLKNVKRRQSLAELGPLRLRMKALKENRLLPQALRDEMAAEMLALPRYSCPIRIKKMCQMTARPRGNVRRFYLSRNLFREYADHGQLCGVLRSAF